VIRCSFLIFVAHPIEQRSLERKRLVPKQLRILITSLLLQNARSQENESSAQTIRLAIRRAGNTAAIMMQAPPRHAPVSMKSPGCRA
jgi:hypothetical protein